MMALSNCKNSLKFLILLGTLGLVCGANLRCYEGSLDKFTDISLDRPEVLLMSRCFDAKKNTIIYAFRFRENSTGLSVQNIIGTYLDLNHNALIMNWENEATVPGLGDKSYRIVVSNLSNLGQKLGRAIVKLSKAGFPLPSLHLLGYSLGAHLMGYAGREIKNNGLLISRMTLFDPAGPLFDGGPGSYSGANKDCAKSVVVIHGNPGGVGTVRNRGTVDIWPNCPCSVQPGCELTKTGSFLQAGCSHERSWMYFVESLKRKKAFPAIAAASCDTWRTGKGTDPIIYLGDNLDERMTLFDPAGPLFDGGPGSYSGANKECAKSVVVIHGNPGGVGTVRNRGTVDIWPNCPCSVQPGCELTKTGSFLQAGCSHERSWMYFVESLKRKKAFPAIAAVSCDTWKTEKRTDQIIYLEDNLDERVKGQFYLRTNSKELFGLGMEGTEPVKTVCSPDLSLNEIKRILNI